MEHQVWVSCDDIYRDIAIYTCFIRVKGSVSGLVLIELPRFYCVLCWNKYYMCLDMLSEFFPKLLELWHLWRLKNCQLFINPNFALTLWYNAIFWTKNVFILRDPQSNGEIVVGKFAPKRPKYFSYPSRSHFLQKIGPEYETHTQLKIPKYVGKQDLIKAKKTPDKMKTAFTSTFILPE